MSKNINVNPDHYKVAGRERQGEEVVNREHKQKFGNVQSDLATRAEQRNESLEAMRNRQARSAREAAPRPGQSRRRTKAEKERSESAAPLDEGEEKEGARRRNRLPEVVRRTAAASVTKVAGSPLVKTAGRRATKATKKTKRAAGGVGAAAAVAARKVASKAKKAVAPRPKQALPKKPGKAVPAETVSKTVPKKKKAAPARKK